MALPPLPAEAVTVGATAGDWRAAVRLVGEALARSGAARVGYTDEMIRMIEEHGPYVVIAPGLALAHARPGPDVVADGLALVTLATPVPFGHPHNDPVSVVLGLAIVDASSHLASVAAIANVFNDSTAIEELAAATTVEEIQRIMGVVA
ncbi:MAG: PTS sugar transporter subunit IIA [Rhodoglobus sp.]